MIVLDDDDLGEIELECDPYVVASFQIGSPDTRSVMRNRALADGMFDDTRFQGGRAVTIALVLNDRACATDAAAAVAMQALYDRLLPFMHPRRRPRMRWTLPGSPGTIRELIVRGDTYPMLVAGPKHPALALSFVAGGGEIMTPGTFCQLIDPAGDVEVGRHYGISGGFGFADDQYGPYYTNSLGSVDRKYPPSAAIGDRIINNAGNADAHWTAALFGIVTNPTFKVNGITVNFNVNGGVVLPAGSSIVIDTRARTMYLNGDPAFSVYDRSNFTAWQWADLMFKPGDNLVRFGGSILGVGASANVCWNPTWA